MAYNNNYKKGGSYKNNYGGGVAPANNYNNSYNKPRKNYSKEDLEGINSMKVFPVHNGPLYISPHTGVQYRIKLIVRIRRQNLLITDDFKSIFTTTEIARALFKANKM